MKRPSLREQTAVHGTDKTFLYRSPRLHISIGQSLHPALENGKLFERVVISLQQQLHVIHDSVPCFNFQKLRNLPSVGFRKQIERPDCDVSWPLRWSMSLLPPLSTHEDQSGACVRPVSGRDLFLSSSSSSKA